MTWTEVVKQSETWTENAAPIRVFSQLVFSHAMHNGKRVFSFADTTDNSNAGAWDAQSVDAETWTAV